MTRWKDFTRHSTESTQTMDEFKAFPPDISDFSFIASPWGIYHTHNNYLRSNSNNYLPNNTVDRDFRPFTAIITPCDEGFQVTSWYTDEAERAYLSTTDRDDIIHNGGRLWGELKRRKFIATRAANGGRMAGDIQVLKDLVKDIIDFNYQFDLHSKDNPEYTTNLQNDVVHSPTELSSPTT